MRSHSISSSCCGDVSGSSTEDAWIDERGEAVVATTTGFIVVGQSHTWGGGITPQHVLSLSEGNRAAWILTPWPGGDEIGSRQPIVWIPSGPDRILADGLLLAGVHAVGDPAVRESFAEVVGEGWDKPRLELDQKRPDLSVVDTVLDRSPLNAALVINVLEGSSLLSQLSRLETLRSEVEIAVTAFSQRFDADGSRRTSGTLPGPTRD